LEGEIIEVVWSFFVFSEMQKRVGGNMGGPSTSERLQSDKAYAAFFRNQSDKTRGI
jgi:hypothetical protein